MKKSIILGVFLLIGVSFMPSLVSADLPPGPNQHDMGLCSKIVNINDYPDLVFIAYNYGPMGTIPPYVIKNNECLKGGYKFGALAIYYVDKNKFNSIDLNNLNTKSTNNVPEITGLNGLSNGVVQYYGGYVNNDTFIKNKILEYSIYKSTIMNEYPGGEQDIYHLYKSKEITGYNNGQANKVETFDVSGKKIDLKKDENKDTKKESQKDTKNEEVNNDKNDNQDTIQNQDQNNNENQNQEVQKPIKRGFWRSILCFFGFSKSC